MAQEEKIFVNRRANTLLTQREKLPWPQDKPFKILSLDGGGMRGLYSASLLKHIEKEMAHGKNISQYFDMIAGTSTGGIIALGLGLNIPTARIASFYTEDGKNIFKNRWWWKFSCLKFVSHLRKSLYEPKALEEVLKRKFDTTILGTATTRLVIPAFTIEETETEVAVFKTDHHPDCKRDWKTHSWEVARSTSAAPTYLNEYKSGSTMFLDGGIWANNPIMIAVIEALSAYDITPQQIKILSIGTGNPSLKRTLKEAGGLYSWRNIIDAAMFLTTDNALSQARLLLGPEKVLRLEPTGDAASIELDDWKKSVAVFPDLAKQHFNDRKEEIKHFFIDTVDPRNRFYTQTL